MSWQLSTAISVITFSISILLRRVLLYKDRSDPFAYVIVFQGLVGILTGSYAIYRGFEMPDISRFGFAMVLTIILYAAGHVVSTGAFRLVEASVFSVLFATSAIWTLIAGIVLFHDRLTVLQIAGIGLLFISVALLVEHKGNWKIDKGILLGLLTGLLFGLATAGWVYVGRHADAASWTALSFIGPALAVAAVKPQSIAQIKHFANGRLLVRMLLLGIIFSISSLASLQAYRTGNVSLVAALQQTGIIITTVLGIAFLGERTKLRRKGLAAVICFAAVVLIV